MKKIIFLLLTSFLVNANLFAQELEQDITYYKFINKLWTMSNAFDKVSFHLDNQSVELEETRNIELKVLDKLLFNATVDLKTLQDEAYKDDHLKSLKEMLTAMKLSLAELKSDAWAEEDSWQLNYNLVKMRLSELETNKSKAVQFSRTVVH